MTVEEYLKSKPPIKLSDIAKKMYPNNSRAASMLNNKLKNVQGRTFDREDAELALKVLKDFSVEIIYLTL